MNCKSARKFLYAFADGQLGVQANCEVLDHLKMCPPCAQLVDEHQTLRAALARSIARVEVPAHLAAQVASRLHLGRASRNRPTWRASAWTKFIAAAACLAFAAGLWQFWPSERSTPAGPSASPVLVEDGQIAASQVADRHLACCALGKGHQLDSLPTARAELDLAVQRRFAGRFAARAPDLSSQAFELESASLCSARGGESGEGCHLIYRSSDGASRLSLFSLPRWDRVDLCARLVAVAPGSSRQYSVERHDGRNLSVFAWHQDQTTYICCSDLDGDRMKQVVAAIRIALSNGQPRLK